MNKIIRPGDRRFYINRNNYIECESHVSVGVSGFYTCEALKPGVGVVRKARFPIHNLLTDLVMDGFGGNPQMGYMHLGTGTTPPAFTNTQLTNFGVSISGITLIGDGVSPSPPYHGYARYQWTSAVGGATGNWTEIGLATGLANGGLKSHALILDGGGNPTVFPVQSDEQFRGTYEIRQYAPTSDSLATINSGASYDTTTRALGVLSESRWILSLLSNNPYAASTGAGSLAYSGALGAVTDAAPLGSNVLGHPTRSTAAYTPGSHSREASFRWGSGVAGTFRTVTSLYNSCFFQTEYDRDIIKTTTQEFIHNQRVSWARR